ncbi:hypothetical protein JCM33374_g1422 [Metschnikowia sp. JCM 33374]|nr:hypothetical protein JCM33374_g1422 [Metschnikowia sp. JCM 33374]
MDIPTPTTTVAAAGAAGAATSVDVDFSAASNLPEVGRSDASKHERKSDATTLRPVWLPASYKEPGIIEALLFHILSCIYSDDSDSKWLNRQYIQLQALRNHLAQNHRKLDPGPSHTFTAHDVARLADNLAFPVSELQKNVLLESLKCMGMACPNVADTDVLLPWIRSLSAPRVTDACAELADLTYIPTCILSDLLLRTPLNADDLALQLDLWNTFIAPIAQENHAKSPRLVANILENLVFYTAQALGATSHTPFIRAQKVLVEHLGTGQPEKSSSKKDISQENIPHIEAQTTTPNETSPKVSSRLSQKGYIGITLLISHESPEKASRLLEITNSHFPESSVLVHIARIYLSATPEELLHNFNVAVLQYPKSGTIWLMLTKKLQQLHLLTEVRSHKLLGELLARKANIVISKEIVLLLLGPIKSISGIEKFISALQKADIFYKYRNVVTNKYMALLYRYSDERSVHKPFLDKLVRNTSNLECARYLYENIAWKTTSIIGIMLNGEAKHRPADLYQLYCNELQGNVPDEACLSALLRASMKRSDGKPFAWGPLYAPQVAVHEFKKYVQSEAYAPDSATVSIFASNKLWQVYIYALRSAEYTAELSEIIRWWEKIQFIPSRSTLMLLLRALPRDFSERHIKHAHSLPQSSMSWPWPALEEFSE